MMRRILSAVTVAVCGMIIAACSVERVSEVSESSFASELARVECAYIFSCECEDYGYPDESFCQDSMQGLYDALIEPARKVGLSYNSECAQQIVDDYADDECIEPVFVDNETDTACDYCSIYHGDKEVGSECTVYADFDDCANGLFCDEGKCVDPCAKAAIGEPCESGSLDGCEAGSYCPLDGETVCTKTPADGEACEYFCGEASYCNFDGVCAAIPKLGEACEGPCADDLACSNDGVCVEPPGIDEPCAGGGCNDEGYCDYGEIEEETTPTCRARKAAGEDCGSSEECLSGYCDETCMDQQPWVCG